MYAEIEMIDKIECKKTKLEMLLMFTMEYGGWLQHLSSVGKPWGAGGEEVGAAKEISKTKDHLNKLFNKALELV